MSDSLDEHLRNRLGALDSEIRHIRLPGPGAARRRGRQRTRNQITGTALAGTVAAAVGILGVLPPLLPADDRPVAEAELTTSAEPEVPGYAPPADGGDDDSLILSEPTSPETEESARPELAENPFLTDDDVNPVGTYSGFTRTDGSTPDDEWFSYRCLNQLADAGAEPLLVSEWFHELDGSIAELVLRMPDEALAERIMTDHTILPEQCGTVAADRDQRHSEPAYLDVAGALEGLVWTVNDEPGPTNAGSSSSFTGVGMAREANVVVVLVFGAMDDPTAGGWDSYAAQTLSRALERAAQ